MRILFIDKNTFELLKKKHINEWITEGDWIIKNIENKKKPNWNKNKIKNFIYPVGDNSLNYQIQLYTKDIHGSYLLITHGAIYHKYKTDCIWDMDLNSLEIEDYDDYKKENLISDINNLFSKNTYIDLIKENINPKMKEKIIEAYNNVDINLSNIIDLYKNHIVSNIYRPYIFDPFDPKIHVKKIHKKDSNQTIYQPNENIYNERMALKNKDKYHLYDCKTSKYNGIEICDIRELDENNNNFYCIKRQSNDLRVLSLQVSSSALYINDNNKNWGENIRFCIAIIGDQKKMKPKDIIAIGICIHIINKLNYNVEIGFIPIK